MIESWQRVLASEQTQESQGSGPSHQCHLLKLGPSLRMGIGRYSAAERHDRSSGYLEPLKFLLSVLTLT